MTDNCPLPQEVIIVEGRDDTKRLIETFGPSIKTIETNGSALDQATIERIRQAHQQYGAIVFTDPDYAGQRLRRKIRQAVPDIKEAHLSQAQTTAPQAGHSLGIEHAKPETIRQALASLATPQVQAPVQAMTMKDLWDLHLVGHDQAAYYRQRVADHFNLGHLNAKQLINQCQKYGICLKEVQLFMEEEGFLD